MAKKNNKIIKFVMVFVLAALFALFLKYGIEIGFLKSFTVKKDAILNAIPIKVKGKYQILLGSFKNKKEAEEVQLKISDIIENCEIKITKNNKSFYVLKIEDIVDEETAKNINSKISDICIGSVVR